ncbi:regulatory protein RecX [Sphingobium quisquiliarum P25]|uniref:Regulatory protein RecX n=1 Tax=Sphingobium quisquiliarum P25 TaxID=1329909 RepID=T0GHI5_9SPHN|nr:RecX family transcriptional regulator [Sphingobium quisquiliarum]EQA99492.1 regulatory protein RecX [Sphingobium quisquiliarum P25]EZP71775.1 Regulatory protein RecX [Sphingomonas paucimobilis]
MTAKRPPPALDEDSLRELALRYVGRFATSRAKLLAYLNRKLKERGWAGAQPPAPDRLVDRLAELRYVDDRGYAVMKSAALSRRGYGARRVAQTLHADGIAPADREEADAQTSNESWAAADRFARRKRIGPYAQARADPKQREKAIAAFLRAGHSYETARRWIDAPPGEPPEPQD